MPLTKYVDRLPILRKARPKGTYRGKPYYEITMRQVEQQLHRDLPPTAVYAYDGVYPGPTFDVWRNKPIWVQWKSALPSVHLLPVDKTVHGAEPPNPEVRTVVHLHGGHVAPHSDGQPEAWFTAGFEKRGPHFSRRIYYYPHIQPAATLWYHDHALAATRLNVYAGLAGFYLIRDKHEAALNLPKGKYEVPLAIQDRSFAQIGQLDYDRGSEPPNPPSIVPEFFGDTILVNGKVWPYLEVEPRVYRVRLLNGSNSRFYRMTLSSGQVFYQIGSDGGLLPRTVSVTTLTLGPGERADVLLDFRGRQGEEIILQNDAPTPFPDGDPVDPDTTGQIMQFRVSLPLEGEDAGEIPTELVKVPKLQPSQARKVRNLTLDETTDKQGRLLMLLTNRMWDDPISEYPLLNSIEIWRLINLTPDTHPIHLHLVQFQVLGRQNFDPATYTEGQAIDWAPLIPPEPGETGWKDTVLAHPNQVTYIIVPFRTFTGVYPWHCHILEHEDHEMMRPYKVIRKGQRPRPIEE